MALISPVGRVSYPNVFKPAEPMQQGGAKKYQITLLIDKDDPLLAQMKDTAAAAAKKKWPNGPPRKPRSPFRDGDERFEEKNGSCPEYKGKFFIQFKSPEDRPPQVVDDKNRPITEASGKFYPGCWARVSYTAYAYDQGGNIGVAFALANVQKVRDDEPFDGRSSAEQDFGPPAGGMSSEDLFGDSPF